MSELTTIVGFMAGFVTTAANLPQVWKTYRSKSGEGLSFRMLLALAIGLWRFTAPPAVLVRGVSLEDGMSHYLIERIEAALGRPDPLQVARDEVGEHVARHGEWRTALTTDSVELRGELAEAEEDLRSRR